MVNNNLFLSYAFAVVLNENVGLDSFHNVGVLLGWLSVEKGAIWKLIFCEDASDGTDVFFGSARGEVEEVYPLEAPRLDFLGGIADGKVMGVILD